MKNIYWNFFCFNTFYMSQFVFYRSSSTAIKNRNRVNLNNDYFPKKTIIDVFVLMLFYAIRYWYEFITFKQVFGEDSRYRLKRKIFIGIRIHFLYNEKIFFQRIRVRNGCIIITIFIDYTRWFPSFDHWIFMASTKEHIFHGTRCLLYTLQNTKSLKKKTRYYFSYLSFVADNWLAQHRFRWPDNIAFN